MTISSEDISGLMYVPGAHLLSMLFQCGQSTKWRHQYFQKFEIIKNNLVSEDKILATLSQKDGSILKWWDKCGELDLSTQNTNKKTSLCISLISVLEVGKQGEPMSPHLSNN